MSNIKLNKKSIVMLILIVSLLLLICLLVKLDINENMLDDKENILKNTEEIEEKYNPLLEVRTYSWSPDGRYIAYHTSYDTDDYIYLYDIDSKKSIYLAEGDVPHWRNNEEIIISEYNFKSNSMYVLKQINAKTKEINILSENNIGICDNNKSFISPNRKYIVNFIETADRNKDPLKLLTIIDLDNTNNIKEELMYLFRYGNTITQVIGWLNNDEILVVVEDYTTLKKINIRKLKKVDITGNFRLEFEEIEEEVNMIENQPIEFKSITYEEAAKYIKGQCFSYDGKYYAYIGYDGNIIITLSHDFRAIKKIIKLNTSSSMLRWSPVEYKLAYIEYKLVNTNVQNRLRIIDVSDLK